MCTENYVEALSLILFAIFFLYNINHKYELYYHVLQLEMM